MDITLNEDQTLLQETALSFAQSALSNGRIRELGTTESGFDSGVWKQMAAMGWAGSVFPEQYGGANAGLIELALIIEALGQGAIPSPIFSTVVEAGLLLLDAGTSAQRENWIPRITSGTTIMRSEEQTPE